VISLAERSNPLDRPLTRREAIRYALLGTLPLVPLIGSIGASGGIGTGSEVDPLAVLLNVPPVFGGAMDQFIDSGDSSGSRVVGRGSLNVLDISSAETRGAFNVVDPNSTAMLQFFNNQTAGNAPQFRIVVPTTFPGALSLMNWGFAGEPGFLTFNFLAADPANVLGLGANAEIIGDDGTINGKSVPQLSFWTDPTGRLDFSHLGSGGMNPLLNGASVGPPIAPAATAGKPVGAGHGHNLTTQSQVGAYFDNSGGTSAPPVRIGRWKNITTAITARRLTVLAQIAPVGGSDVYELTDLTTTLQVTLGAGATEAESSSILTRNFAANSILYFRLASSTATTQSQKVNLIADYNMNG
jgi:hypothetical protein